VNFLFRIFIAILSGISTYFAFPSLLGLIDRILSRTVFLVFPYWVMLWLFVCVTLPLPIYYAFTCRDTKKIQMPKRTQAIIVFTAASLPIAIFIFVVTSFKGPISLLLWNIALLLNLFFFLTVVLSSLYYLLRTALTVKRQQEAALPHEQPQAKK